MNETPAEAVAARVRAAVAASAELAELLARQARALPAPVFGRSDIPALEFLELYLDEARHLFGFVESQLTSGVRLLEVGGGPGLFHLFARAAGAEVASIEPSMGGFSHFREFGLRLIGQLGGDPERFLDCRVEALPFRDGCFDLVVSNNVLEHVDDVARALLEMYRVTAPGGRLLHCCPNYLVPYEPHYKVPVLPCAVSLSGRLVWRRYRADPLWRSINSISALSVMRVARRLPGARLVFRDAFAPTLRRLSRPDALLTRRHGALARLLLSRPLRALAWLPAPLLTPMLFEIAKPGSAPAAVSDP